MAYIIFLNPLILTSGFKDADPAFTAVALSAGTALVAGIMTIAMGIVGNYPLALAAGLGINGIVAFSQTDFTEDLKKITVPVLVMHGDDDQIVPYADSAPLSAKLLKNSTLKTYKGFPHGMPTTEADTINADLLAFVKA